MLGRGKLKRIGLLPIGGAELAVASACIGGVVGNVKFCAGIGGILRSARRGHEVLRPADQVPPCVIVIVRAQSAFIGGDDTVRQPVSSLAAMSASSWDAPGRDDAGVTNDSYSKYSFRAVTASISTWSNMLACLLEIEKTTAVAIAGTAPNPFLWGKMTAPEFLAILEHVTTWALTHFEPVRSWSVAEDFTPTEEQEGYGLIGRGQRMSASDYRPQRLTRCLREITNPRVRGAALWTAHAVLATCHTAASDRSSGATPQDRQVALFAGSAPASRQWLAQRQANWPPEYRRSRWIDLQEMV